MKFLGIALYTLLTRLISEGGSASFVGHSIFGSYQMPPKPKEVAF